MEAFAQEIPNWEHTAEDAHWVSAEHGLAACLDGLAGHGGGALASSAAARGASKAEPGPGWAERAWHAAKEAMLSARAKSPYPDARAAAVFARLDPALGGAELAWSGDCRAYKLTSEGQLLRLTDDHDTLSQMIAEGRVGAFRAGHVREVLSEAQTKSEAWHMGGSTAKKLFNKRHLMTRELTSSEPELKLVEGFAPGDTLLLSSDGLHDNVPRSRLAELAAELVGADLQELCQVLSEEAVHRARAGEGRAHADDVTVVALRL